VLSPGGLAAIDWLLASWDRDLDGVWAEHGDVGKLKGPVAKYLDWRNVSAIVVLYNAWHLRATAEDERIRHVEEHLAHAAFGDRFKGTNPGGAYILLLEYRNSDRRVVVGFKNGVFLIEGIDGIGAVDIRGSR
jgi:sugar phosphate isomerase/epimerase